jgi:hypothetical protein
MTGRRLFPGGPSQEVSSLIGCIYIQPTHGAPNPWRRQFRNSIKTKQHTLMMIDVYYFESTLKTNRFDCNWGIRQKRYKSKNSIIITSKETRVDHDDED